MISGRYYYPIFLYSVIFLTIWCANKLSHQNFKQTRTGESNFPLAFIVSIVFAIFLGLRPIHSGHFGDSTNYALTYTLYKIGFNVYTGDETEWLWARMMSTASNIIDISTYFTIIDLLYFGFTLWACKRLCPNNVLVALLFTIGSFSFYTYGTNGIRNGLACSIVLVVIACMMDNKRNLPLSIILSACAIAIHKTTMLPLMSLFTSIYLVKSFKWAYTFWILSILISLVAGGTVSAFFAGLGFDSRLSYITSSSDGQYTKTWFRWDFLIYSMMPIVLGYYVVIKRSIQDRTYMILLNTYTLANAFWVMVIRASYSNRFAYLSWFMYPLVLAYPLLKLDIWGDKQGKYAAWIMLAHVGFTWFMATIY